MDLQCAYCNEPVGMSTDHSCAKTIASLRAELLSVTAANGELDNENVGYREENIRLRSSLVEKEEENKRNLNEFIEASHSWAIEKDKLLEGDINVVTEEDNARLRSSLTEKDAELCRVKDAARKYKNMIELPWVHLSFDPFDPEIFDPIRVERELEAVLCALKGRKG